MAKTDMDSLFTRDQVESAKDLHGVIQGLVKEMEALRKSQGSQIETSRQLASAFGEVEKSVDETAKKMEKLRQLRLEQFREEINDARSVTELASKAAEYYADQARTKYPVAFGAAAGALVGFKQGLTNVAAAAKVGINFVKTLTGTLFRLGGAILSIPFKMFSAIIDIADSAGGGTDELREAIENLRGEYGSLKQETPQAIMSTAKELKGFSDTGLSAFRIFGNMANRLKEVAQLATDMGAVFESFTDEFRENGGAILAWQRGLGLSGEQMKTIGQRAKTMGTTMSEELMMIQKLSQGMGKDFGIAAKNISKDMATAAANVKQFGGATIKQMAQASVYVRRLGVELDKVVGLMDAFDTFENAAQNASKLSQAFGVQIDAFKMLKAQSVDEVLDTMRQGFARAGKDASSFNRQQISLLASTTNLDPAIAKQVFSLKNQGVSLDKVRASAEKSEKRTLSQAEAMKELADAIKRMVQSGGGDGAKGFFAKYLAGISRGIQSTVAFRTMIWSIRRAMWETRYEGVRLGRALVENFPGMKKYFEGIKGFFTRDKFKPLIKGVTDDIIGFVKGMSSGNYSFETLMNKLRKRFFNYFDQSSESGRNVVKGFKEMFAAISKIAGAAIRWMSSKVRDGIVFITDLITGKRKLGDVSGLGFFANALEPLFEAFKYAWQEITPVLLEALSHIGDMVLGWIKAKLLPLLSSMAPYIALALFGPALVRGLLGALMGAAGGKLLAVGKKFLDRLLPKAAATAKGAELGAAIEQGRQANQRKIKAIHGPGFKPSAAGGGAGASKSIEAGASGAQTAMGPLLKLAGFIAFAGMGIAVALGAIRLAMLGMTLEQAMSMMGVIVAVAVASIPLALALKIVNPLLKDDKSLLKGLSTLSAVLIAMGLVGAALGWLFSKIAAADMLKSVGEFMLSLSLVFLAMIPVVLAAAALGGLLLIPAVGALIAGSIVGGMAAIGAAVLGLAGVAVSILGIISAVNVGADLKAKTDAFVSVMNVIAPFAKTVADIMGELQPSIIELLTFTSFKDKVDSAVSFITTLFGDENNNKGITGLLNKVTGILMVFTMFPGIGSAARVFSDVMSGLSSAMTALAPPPAFYDAITNWLGFSIDAISQAKGWIEAMGTQLISLIGVITPFVKTLLSSNIPSSSGVEAIAKVIGSVGALVGSIMPSPEFFEAFKETSSASLLIISAENSTLNSGKLIAFMTTYFEKIGPLIEKFSSGVVNDILREVSKVDTGKLEKLGPLAEIMKAVADLIKTISDPSKVPQVDAKKIGGMNNVVNITNTLPDFGRVLEQVGEKMGPFISRLVKAVQGVPADDKVFMQKLEAAKTMFSLLGEIRGLIDAVPKEEATEGKTAIPPSLHEKLLESIDSINEFLRAMAGTKLSSLLSNIERLGGQLVAQRGQTPISKTMTKLADFFKQLSESVGSMKTIAEADMPTPAAMTQKLETIIGVLNAMSSKTAAMSGALTRASTSIGSTSKTLKDYGFNLGSMARAIREGGIAQGLKAVSDVIQKVNEINTALEQPKTFDVATKLKVLANNIGMGSDASFNFDVPKANITINLKVEMNAKDMEKAIVMRAESVIRDRLNFAAYDAPGEKAARPIPPGGELPGAPVQGSGASFTRSP